jgi:hypothetical protein
MSSSDPGTAAKNATGQTSRARLIVPSRASPPRLLAPGLLLLLAAQEHRQSGTFVSKEFCVARKTAACLDAAGKSTLNTGLRLSSVTCIRHPRQSGPSGMKGTVCLTIRTAWRWAASQSESSTPSQSRISALS